LAVAVVGGLLLLLLPLLLLLLLWGVRTGKDGGEGAADEADALRLPGAEERVACCV
jgi:hypothetical protein